MKVQKNEADQRACYVILKNIIIINIVIYWYI